MSKLPQGGRLCPQRQDDTNREPSGEKRLTETITEGFFFFSFLPKAFGASDNHQPAVGEAEAQLPGRSAEVRSPLWQQALDA